MALVELEYKKIDGLLYPKLDIGTKELTNLESLESEIRISA